MSPTTFVAPSVAGQPADDERPAWLCFESRTEKRRLIPAPSDWDARTDEELERMRHDAEVVARPARAMAPDMW